MSAGYRTGLRPATFVAGSAGQWRIDGIKAVSGEGLDLAARLDVREGVVTADGV